MFEDHEWSELNWFCGIFSHRLLALFVFLWAFTCFIVYLVLACCISLTLSPSHSHSFTFPYGLSSSPSHCISHPHVIFPLFPGPSAPFSLHPFHREIRAVKTCWAKSISHAGLSQGGALWVCVHVIIHDSHLFVVPLHICISVYVCVVTTSYEGTSLTCRLQLDFLPDLTDIVNKKLKLAFIFGFDIKVYFGCLCDIYFDVRLQRPLNLYPFLLLLIFFPTSFKFLSHPLNPSKHKHVHCIVKKSM